MKECGRPHPPSRGGRRRENLSREQEEKFLAPFFDAPKGGGILAVTRVRTALEARLGGPVALLLHRHCWRKLAPDKRHRNPDPPLQEAWKKLKESLQDIGRTRKQEGTLPLLFQDEARFGRISGTRAVLVPDGMIDRLILPHVSGT